MSVYVNDALASHAWLLVPFLDMFDYISNNGFLFFVKYVVLFMLTDCLQ
jgi:hypothetical protein